MTEHFVAFRSDDDSPCESDNEPAGMRLEGNRTLLMTGKDTSQMWLTQKNGRIRVS
jgi:hypothetical protein